jgi:hypothetical protein
MITIHQRAELEVDEMLREFFNLIHLRWFLICLAEHRLEALCSQYEI